MRLLVRRIGFRNRRRLTVGLLAVSAAAVVLWLLPWRAGPASLELVALGSDGRFQSEVQIPRTWTDTSVSSQGALARVPLVLGVVNSGGRPARPGRLEISMPARFQLRTVDGRPVSGELGPGTPLIRYRLEMSFPRIEPGRVPTLLPALDTLWLELALPSFYCIALSDSVPEFVPAPPPPVNALSRVEIFYSFEGGELKNRQTGLLRIQLDPTVLRRAEAPRPPSFPSEVREPGFPLPPLVALKYGGARRSYCGEPEQPLEMLTTLWETVDGGRFFVLDYGGAPRKYLFDLNRDGIIELEMWDPDADGNFEARRRAALPIPSFLIPPTTASPFDPEIFASIPEDSVVRLDRFWQNRVSPYRLRTQPPDTAPDLRVLRPMAIVREDDEDRPRRPRSAPTEPTRPRPPRRILGVPSPTGGAPPAEGGAPTPATPRPRTEGGAEPAEQPTPRPPRPPVKLLGTPVDSIGAR